MIVKLRERFNVEAESKRKDEVCAVYERIVELLERSVMRPIWCPRSIRRWRKTF